jgi:hypothetical protein
VSASTQRDRGVTARRLEPEGGDHDVVEGIGAVGDDEAALRVGGDLLPGDQHLCALDRRAVGIEDHAS